MSGWWIIPGKQIVTVDDAPMDNIDCSTVPLGIYLIRWWGTSGEILYNHDTQLPVREPFTDMTPYINLFNKWMAAAEIPGSVTRMNEGSPPITVPQAKQVKTSMVDALFASKRQMPVSAYGYTWDASDNATGAMTDQIAALSGTDAINSAVGALAASVNSALGSLASNTDSAIQGLASGVNNARSADANALNDSLNSQAIGHNSNVTAANANFDTIAAVVIDIPSVPMTVGMPGLGHEGGIGTPSMPVTPTATPPAISAPSVAATPATGPNIAWPPLGASPVTLTYVQFTDLLKTITSRRNSLQQVRTTHKNNVAAMSDVPTIVAYDITTGW
jgi:hypothetical protein